MTTQQPEALQCAADIEAPLEAIGAGGVSGPLIGQPQAMPDLSQLTERGAKAWAGVDAQGLREGFTAADMATVSAQGFRDGVASVSAWSEPVAEIGSAAGDCAAFGERALYPLVDIDRFDYGTMLYAHPSPPEGMAGRKWVPIEPTDAMWNAMMDWGTKKSEWLAILDAAPVPADGESNV